MIVVIDYGMGNLRSVSKALEHVTDERILVSGNADEIAEAEKVVFPGVGSIGDCMAEIKRLNLQSIIANSIQTRPVLGICLGMQSMLDFSEENNGTDCIGVISGKVKKFPNLSPLKVPHMGWNQVQHNNDHPLWQNIESQSRFYFVHSYYADPTDQQDVAATTTYDMAFCSAVAKGNLFATQFHPEKSQHDGLQLLKNFTLWKGDV
jgi:imidazole glycerol-phosphate synthase subunit HisH